MRRLDVQDMMTRKDFVRNAAYMGAGAALLGVAGCGQSAPAGGEAAGSSKLRVSEWGGAFGALIEEVVGPEFKRQTGVEYEFVLGGSTEAGTKLRTERANPGLDVVYWDPAWAARIAKELDLLIPIQEKAELIPNLGELETGFFEEEVWSPFTVAAWANATTLLYRADKIDKSKVSGWDSWTVILDPAYKGHVTWPDANYGSGWGLMMLSMIGGAGTIQSGKPHDFQPGIELAKKLEPQVVTFYKGDDEAATLIKSGEAWLRMGFIIEAPAFQGEGVDVQNFLDVKEGLALANEAISIVRTGRTETEDLAAKWINIHLSPEVQSQAPKYGFTPIHKSAQVPPEFRKNTLTTEQLRGMEAFDWVWMGENGQELQDAWDRALS